MKLKIRLFILLLIVSISLMACNNKEQGDEKSLEKEEIQSVPDIQEVIIRDPILEKIATMSLREKIGQLIIVGFDGNQINEEAMDYIENLKVGGFIFFKRNIVDPVGTLKLVNDLKEANSKNKLGLFLSIDEEGGKVSRLPEEYIKIPEMLKFGSKNDLDLSYELGYNLGQRVGSLGLNMNFAPVLDINSNSNNPVIGDRAFGNTVESVSENALAVMKGIRDSNIIPGVKHFPGHGDTSVDSHINLPSVNKSMDDLKNFELIPFVKAIENKVEIIMVGHILYPQIDPNKPSTMSPKLIEGLLRRQLAYQGVVVSDDMTMGAIVENNTIEESVLSFIQAGGDIALVCHGRENPAKIIDRLEKAINDGQLRQGQIDEKLYRIITLKEKYNINDELTNEKNIDEINNNTREIIEKINQ